MLGKTVLLLKSVLMRMGPPCVPYAVMDSCFLLTLHVCNHEVHAYVRYILYMYIHRIYDAIQMVCACKS